MTTGTGMYAIIFFDGARDGQNQKQNAGNKSAGHQLLNGKGGHEGRKNDGAGDGVGKIDRLSVIKRIKNGKKAADEKYAGDPRFDELRVHTGAVRAGDVNKPRAEPENGGHNAGSDGADIHLLKEIRHAMFEPNRFFFQYGHENFTSYHFLGLPQ
jgi:hypothetical protein